MPELYHSFINLVFIGIIALFPVVNPVGSAFIVSTFFEGLSPQEKRVAVGKITLYAFLVCTVSLFAGHWILRLFGLSIPVIQLAGGITICKMGWELLSNDTTNVKEGEQMDYKDEKYRIKHTSEKLFYPITFPVTTGAGTISVLITLSAHSDSFNREAYIVNTLAIMTSILVMCLLIYIFYLNTKTIIHFLGTSGENIVNRISAFLIFCVGLQIALTGLKTIFKL